MSFTKIQIISTALILVGKDPITSIAQGGKFAAAADLEYDLLKEAIISQNNWRFATKVATLSRLTEAPPIDEYNYIYQLPVDYLALWRLKPNSLNFQIYANKHLYSNEQSLQMEYRFVPDEGYWPMYFVNFFRAELARNLAIGASNSLAYAELIEKIKNINIGTALAADAQSHPSAKLANDPLIAVRGQGARRYA